ncbi:hypothetical protein J4H86_08935 [Spiractinospora alimapuensis]|nr:hypothetical protein [Spiractinospora alimapuensis]QVQ53816.1 hypothetical protein J4H86_08935 [Spiractinospora alimapuensis]
MVLTLLDLGRRSGDIRLVASSPRWPLAWASLAAQVRAQTFQKRRP